MALIDTTKAAKRLESAKFAVREMERGEMTFPDFERVWFNFLIAANGVYLQLERAAQNTPQNRQWYGTKKRERKSDPMLQYLQQARHSEEHTLEVITAVVPSYTVTLTQNVTIDFSPEEGLVLINEDGSRIPLGTPTPRLSLMNVTGRGGDVFPVPTSHLGQPIMPEPLLVARLALDYLSALLKEAKSRA